jgi:RNA polymerase sigma-70 factor (ECF subfamily)
MAESPESSSTDLSSTADLLDRARHGDPEALNELLRRHLEPLRRWARGRLPRWTRDLRDTDDLVQDTLVHTLRHVDDFELRNEGALQSYLRQAVVNRVRDQVRRFNRNPLHAPLEYADGFPDPGASPLDEAIGREAAERFEAALQRLRPDDRDMIIARIELQQSYAQIAATHGKSSADSARMAVTRALVRLAEEMESGG